MHVLVACRGVARGPGRRLGAWLRDHGHSAGPGLFECELDEAQLAELRALLLSRQDAPGQGFAVYPLCGHCAGQAEMLGQARDLRAREWVII